MIRILSLALGVFIGGGLVVACDAMTAKRPEWQGCTDAPCIIERGTK